MKILNGLIFTILIASFSNCTSQEKRCAENVVVNTGYIDSSWVYHNKGLGMAFILPNDWYLDNTKSGAVANLTRIGSSSKYIKDIFQANILYTLKDSAKEYEIKIVPLLTLHYNNRISEDTLSYKSFNNKMFVDVAVFKSATGDVEQDLVLAVNKLNNVIELLPYKKDKIKSSIYNYIKIGNTKFYSNTTIVKYTDGQYIKFGALKKIGCVNIILSASCEEESQLYTLLKGLNKFSILETK
jgi:hypothetical protein